MSAIEDREEIARLKYRYLRLLDTKQWEEFADVFVEDASADYNGLEFADPAALVDYMRTNMGPGMMSMHQVHHPEIDVDGDEATAIWYLQDRVIIKEFDYGLEGAAFYNDRYRRTPQGWRIAYTSYRRTHELTWKLSDVPSLRLRGPGVHVHH